MSATETLFSELQKSFESITKIVNGCRYDDRGFIISDDPDELMLRLQDDISRASVYYRLKSLKGAAMVVIPWQLVDRFALLVEDCERAYLLFLYAAHTLYPRSEEWRKARGDMWHALEALKETRGWGVTSPTATEWLSIASVARGLDWFIGTGKKSRPDSGKVSRKIENGDLTDNGKVGHDRRVSRESVAKYVLAEGLAWNESAAINANNVADL